MGIRFFCPNGHKLNVKSFLAGKRGYCPKCQTKLTVPMQSAPALAKAEAEEAELDITNPALPAEAKQVVAQQAAVGTTTSQSADLLPSGDAEPHWYVCPPSGGQYGPVDTETVHQWIREGRVTADSLVWRNGWPDWLNAGNVFDSFKLGSSNGRAAAKAAGAGAVQRGKSDRMQIATIVLLVLAAILLTGALVLVWT